MRMLNSFLKKTSFIASRRLQGHAPATSQDELKRSDSGEVSTDGNTSKTTIESTKLVDILDVENEVEIQDHHVRATERVASVVFEDEVEDYEDMHEIGRDDLSNQREKELNAGSETPIVDRTPSKIHAIAQDQPKAAHKKESIKEEGYNAHQVPAPGPESDPAATPSSLKPKYTKEEKQRRFLKELFRITSRHIKDRRANEDDDSIVSSAVGSASSVPPPTPLEQFLQWFSCAANFQSGAIMDVENPCPCNKDHKTVSSHAPESAIILEQAAVVKDDEDIPLRKDDDDSLDQALAGMPLQSPSDLSTPIASPTLTLPIPSPITVREDTSTNPDEIIEGDENSATITVKYSVRHVSSMPDESHPNP
jgi:hypothetical protein